MVVREFKEQSIYRMRESLERIERCVGMLNNDQVWTKPNESSNSIGNLIVHLEGNITQYVLAGLGSKEDDRQRDQEFAMEGGLANEELLEKIGTCIQQANEVIENLPERSMTEMHHIQAYHLSSIGVIVHVVEHLSYHTGQIAFFTKLLLDKDLGFYAGVDLNKRQS